MNKGLDITKDKKFKKETFEEEINTDTSTYKYKEVINLTYHNNLKEIESGLSFPMSPTGTARVEKRNIVIHHDPRGFSIEKTEYGEISGLDLDNIDPEKLYIVSVVVLNALHSKGIFLDNIVCPAESIRDRNNNVIANKGFRING
jgi:hypothetical protein